ncbi:succinylglutamate desuccinylase/aspartoacylase [Nostoc commune NIES-4072]|uniref:Probable aspartoacylase n=1 Tax=Nostoc commune NIES-4072 TaxID=2005467 RepID=A0A2R5FUZ9_NOSCO|nr:aspartoacylase [Nostoc commune]BBD67159.1 succinylglutamate desuccinylase/aspartoacylase [Nostoc commune HK-02]GBG21859.1 succinylglutamate desuccinylase/aspartoacylase [Nostoc commune NIES-4072]
MNQINRVAIVGGTHGNEFTGAYLIQKFSQFPNLITRQSFETVTLLANPNAFAAGRRYVEKDLNRCFLKQDLQDPTLSSYEELQAKSIQQTLASNKDKQADFILDLHSSTANMGLTIILVNSHPLNLKLAAYLSQINPLVRVYRCSFKSIEENPFVNSLCELGFAIEVGPIAQGLLKATLFQQTEELVYAILDYLERFNQGEIPSANETLILYDHLSVVDYPKQQDDTIFGMIHPELQDKDYQALNPGDPIFITFDNKIIIYEGASTVWPIFINEAAYYEKRIAMCFTQRQQINI